MLDKLFNYVPHMFRLLDFMLTYHVPWQNVLNRKECM